MCPQPNIFLSFVSFIVLMATVVLLCSTFVPKLRFEEEVEHPNLVRIIFICIILASYQGII